MYSAVTLQNCTNMRGGKLLSTELKYKFEVLVLYFSISIHISKGNIALFTPLQPPDNL